MEVFVNETVDLQDEGKKPEAQTAENRFNAIV